VIAPTPDVRYLEGINGRIPRVCQFLNKEENKVTDDAVTTILLNPTAKVSFALCCAMCLLSCHICASLFSCFSFSFTHNVPPGNAILVSLLAA
jgi:hypothetical protein